MNAFGIEQRETAMTKKKKSELCSRLLLPERSRSFSQLPLSLPQTHELSRLTVPYPSAVFTRWVMP